MSLIPYNEMNILKSADEVSSIADTAIHDQQLSQVALAINTAANTGEHRCTYASGKLLDSVLQKLKDEGYQVNQDAEDRSAATEYTILFKSKG